MSNLYIAITGIEDPAIERRAVEALAAAGIEVYRSWIEPNPIELDEARTPSNRDHLVGQKVKLTLNTWAVRGQPTEGVFNGQGESGFSILVEGGGRYRFSHHEVKDVTLA